MVTTDATGLGRTLSDEAGELSLVQLREHCVPGSRTDGALAVRR